jgi:hypothetical protein
MSLAADATRRKRGGRSLGAPIAVGSEARAESDPTAIGGPIVLRCEVHHSITSSAESEQRCRHLDAERFGGFQVDDEREPGRLHDRQIGGLGALGDAAGIGASLDALFSAF